jgi:hypothetical protein
MDFSKPFSLLAILGAETSTAENENYGMLSLQFGELSAFRSVVGKLIDGEDGGWNNVRSHGKSSTVGCALPGYVSMIRRRCLDSGLSQRAAPETRNVKNRQSLGPMQRSHPLPYPARNVPRPRHALRPSARRDDRLPAPRGRTKVHTCPKSPGGAAASRASMSVIWGSCRRSCGSRRTGRFESPPGRGG